MHLKSRLRLTLFSIALIFAARASAAEKAPAPASPPDAYPLKTCVVSDEPLGSMGDYIVYTHKEAGKPDRVVRLCCDGCIDDFKKEPAKFLAKLDAAAAGKKAPANTAAKEKH